MNERASALAAATSSGYNARLYRERIDVAESLFEK
jgi:hypothetical protein